MMENRIAAQLNNKGFTLIEFLVALVILTVGLLGLLQTVNYALSHNLQNQLRNEAVMVADAEMAKELSKGYDLVDITTSNYVVTRQVLKAAKDYTVTRSGSALQNSKKVDFVITWQYKNAQYTHGASAVISKTNQ